MKSLFSRPAAAFLVPCTLLALALVLTRVDTSHVRASANAPAAQQSAAPARWEYQTLAAKSPEALVALANQGGADSWELVSAVHVLNTNQYQWVGFFKRVKR